MKYKHFNEWELAEDEYFVNWVLRPEAHSDKFWKQFLENNPEKSAEILLAKKIVANIQYAGNPRLDQIEYVKLFERILNSKRVRQSANIQLSGKRRRLVWLRYAAIFLLICAGAVLYQRQTAPTIDPDAGKKIELLTKESPEGSKLTTFLSDGSKVILNASSKITYPKTFSDSLRWVYLTGEAFFEIKSDSTRLFRVKSDFVNTEVLGTSFNVKAYSGATDISVAVAEGKVMVRSTHESSLQFEHTLLPYQEAKLDVKKGEVVKREFLGEQLFAWTKWQLIFDKEPLGKVIEELERWYGVRFEGIGTINTSETYSGSFDNDPLKVVLEALKSQNAFNYKIVGKKVLILKN